MNTKQEKHTPGPWTVKEGVDYVGVCVAGQGGTVVDFFNENKPHKQNLANAHLIASAPELLEACRLAVVDYEYQNDGYAPRPDAPVIKALKQAIAKAEGRV